MNLKVPAFFLNLFLDGTNGVPAHLQNGERTPGTRLSKWDKKLKKNGDEPNAGRKSKAGAKEERGLNENSSTAISARGLPPVHDIIGEKLREYYDDITKEDVPDRFIELLKILEKSSSSAKEN